MKTALVKRLGLYTRRQDQTIRNIISNQLSFNRSKVYLPDDYSVVSLKKPSTYSNFLEPLSICRWDSLFKLSYRIVIYSLNIYHMTFVRHHLKITLVERLGLYTTRFGQTIRNIIISSQISFKRSTVYSSDDDKYVL